MAMDKNQLEDQLEDRLEIDSKRLNSTRFNPKNLTLAISAVLAAPAAGPVFAQDDDEGSESFLEEVLVTARKKEESLQDIPTSIQAISAQQLKQAGLYALDDYVRFVPSMSYITTSPGTAKIIFRGIADAPGTFIAEPSAAIYLDEQSLTLTATPDPRMVDIERIEALSGPQGTIYGASSQSGTLRIITNKPDPTQFESFVDMTLKNMSEGELSYDVSAMANIPINDSFAIRLVGFSARDGGFVDNVLGTTPRFGLFDNADFVDENINDTQYFGGRISARWLVNEDWTVTAGIVHQDTQTNFRNEFDPTRGDLNVVRFFDEYNDQDWTQYSLTLEGDLGFADFVSATAYFERDWEYTQDTTSYASYFGTFCYLPYGINYSRYCFQPAGVGAYYNDPIGHMLNTQRNTKFSQEFRLSHQGSKLDWLVGAYYEKHKEGWDFTTFAQGYEQSQSFANFLAGNLIGSGNPIPTQSPGDAWWFSADRTTFKQLAFFGDTTIHINDQWDASFGARWFNRKMDKKYFVQLPRFNLTDEGISNPTSDESDWVPKASLSYKFQDDKMLYALYSEGFRAGGTNRGRGLPFFPLSFQSDTLENIELGAKTRWMEGKLQVNVTYFDMSWKNYQIEVVDPSNLACGSANAPPAPTCGQPWQKVVANVGNASSTGLELAVDAAPTENISFGFNATWLDAVLDEDVLVSVPVPKGSRLPLSPEFKGSAYAQYGWNVNWFGGGNAYVRLQWSYTGDMLNQLEPLDPGDYPAPQLVMPSYDIGDLKIGLNATDWQLQFFVNNLTDTRANLFANTFEFDNFFGGGRGSVNRPREYGLRYIKTWN